MEVIQTSADGLKREFKVVVDSQEIETRIVGRLDELRKTVNIPGFRPGKVPASLLRKRYGATLRGEILEQAVNQTSSQALAEQNVRPAVQPRIEITKFEEGANLEYTMAVELLPDVVPGDFSTIKLTRLSVDIAESEVDASLERLAASEKNFVAVEKPRKAEKGDALVIDFVGSVDGAEFDGGTASDHLLELVRRGVRGSAHRRQAGRPRLGKAAFSRQLHERRAGRQGRGVRGRHQGNSGIHARHPR